jgi:hypothetical protein
MAAANLLRKIARKGSNPTKIAAEVIRCPDLIDAVVEGLSAKQPAVKYGCEKVLRKIGEMQPDLLYPYFDFLAAMLNCDNSFLKWGAIQNIAHLARVDAAGKFELIFDKYYTPIPGPVMITAASIIASSARVALAKPHLADRIAAEILKVESAVYKTPECRNVAIGHAIDSFDQFFDRVQTKNRIVQFVQRQLQNSRAPVRKRAEKFLKKRKISY